MDFSRSEYWSREPFPSPGDLPNPGTKPRSPVMWADSLPAEPQGKPKITRVGSLSPLQRSSQPQNWTWVSCIAGRFFTTWALRGAPFSLSVHAKLLQSCLTLCNTVDCSPPGSSVHVDSRQEHWSLLPCSPPRELSNPGIQPHLLRLLHWHAGSLPLANKMDSFYPLNLTAAFDTLSLLYSEILLTWLMIPFLSLFLHVCNHSFSFEGFFASLHSFSVVCPHVSVFALFFSLYTFISMS